MEVISQSMQHDCRHGVFGRRSSCLDESGVERNDGRQVEAVTESGVGSVWCIEDSIDREGERWYERHESDAKEEQHYARCGVSRDAAPGS